MTLLTIVQNVADEIGLAKPTTVVGSTDQTVRTLLAFANRSVKDLARVRGKFGAGWTILQRENAFTTTASTAEYSLPSDFDRFIDETAWDQTNYRAMRGNLSPQAWQAKKSGLIASSQFDRSWRVKRAASGVTNKFNVDPTPTTTGDNLIFEYVSNSPIVKASDSSVTTAWTADADTTLLDETLVELNMIWRFKSAKGWAYAIDLADFESQRDMAIAADGGAPTIYMAGRSFDLPEPNIPDTGFGS